MGMVTMGQIAAQLGVSRTTVSLVLDKCRHPAARVSPATRRRIEDTARRVGYVRHERARNLITGRNRELAFISLEPDIEYVARVLEGMLDESARQDYHVKIFPVHRVEDFLNVVDACIGQRPAGILCRSLTPLALDHLRELATACDIPVGVIDCFTPLNWGLRVLSSEDEGVRLAVEHLRGLGHRRIAHVTRLPLQGYTASRWASFRKALVSAGLAEMKDALIAAAGAEELEAETARRLQDRTNAPTAVICGSDMIAMQVLRAARRAGCSVPRDVSVVGMANLLMSAYADPPLTTVEQPFADVGRQAAALLIGEVEADERTFATQSRVAMLNMRLVVRESTGICGGETRE
jgi:LacI family transcriptional regulator